MIHEARFDCHFRCIKFVCLGTFWSTKHSLTSNWGFQSKIYLVFRKEPTNAIEKYTLSLCNAKSLVILLPIIYHYFVKFVSQFFPGSLEIASSSGHLLFYLYFRTGWSFVLRNSYFSIDLYCNITATKI